MNWREWLSHVADYSLKTLRWLLAPTPLGSIGWGVPTLVAALLLTWMSYLIMNSILCGNVTSALRQDRPEGFQESMTADEFRRRIRLATNAPAALDKEPFTGSFQVGPDKKPVAFAQIYLELIRRIVRGDRVSESTDAVKDIQWKQIIEDHLTGQMSGWMIYKVETRPISGQRLLDDLAKAEPALSTRLNELKDGDKIRDFLIRFGELASQPTHSPIRSLNRINGLVQWVTVWLFWVILITLLRRVLYLVPLARAMKTNDIVALESFRSSVTTQLPADAINQPTKIADAYRDHIRGADASAFRTIEFLTTLLPSLGFIGTVVGMGDALLAADGLFSAKDKQQTITHITQQLGYAFDTTLVALLAGLVAGVLVVQCRLWENRVYTLLGRRLFNPTPNQ